MHTTKILLAAASLAVAMAAGIGASPWDRKTDNAARPDPARPVPKREHA